jgi:hypothetical protein
MLRKYLVKAAAAFMLCATGWTLTACGSSSDEEEPNTLYPESYDKTGEYVKTIGQTEGVSHLDSHLGDVYIETADGTRYYVYPTTTPGSAYVNVTMKEGANVIFEGKVHSMSDRLYEEDAVMKALSEKVKLFSLIEPDYTIVAKD